MSELYTASSAADRDAPRETDRTAPADAGADTRFTEEELPARQETWQAATGDDAQYYTHDDIDAAYSEDPNDEPYLANGDDQIPTRQEAWDMARDDAPQYYTQDDIDAAYAEDQGTAPEQHEALPVDAGQADVADARSDTAANEASDTSGRGSPDEGDLPQEDVVRDDGRDSPSTENPGSARSDLAMGETNPDRSSELKNLTEENAELKQRLTAIEARFERMNDLEERLSILERSESDRSLTNEADQLRAVDDRTQPEENSRAKAERVEQPRSGWSNEAVGFAATLSGGALTVAGDFMSAVPAEVAGGVGSALGVGASAVSWWRKHKEVKDANRS